MGRHRFTPADHPHVSVRVVESIAAGDRGGLLRIARRAKLSAADAEDVVQSALMSSLERASDMPIDTNWRAWLTIVVRRAAIDVVRRDRRRARILSNDSELPMWPISVSEKRNDVETCVTAALRECAPALREAFVLWHWEELSYKAIAERQGVLASTVATRIHRVRLHLRANLEAQRRHDVGRSTARKTLETCSGQKDAPPDTNRDSREHLVDTARHYNVWIQRKVI